MENNDSNEFGDQLDDIIDFGDAINEFVDDENCLRIDLDGTGQSVEIDVATNEQNQLNLEKNVNEDDLVLGKKFYTLDEAYEWYNQYALMKGFGIRIQWNTKSRKTNVIIRRRFVCNKEGFKSIKNMEGQREVKRHRDTRTGCGALLDVKATKEGNWIVCKFVDVHNHDISTPSKVIKHRSHATYHRSMACKSLISELSNAGVRPSVISRAVNVFSGKNEVNVTFAQCSQSIRNERRRNIGKECYGIIKHFQEKAACDDSYFFAMDLDESGTLRSVFWSDGRSRKRYTQFGDVIVFDVTYRTNKFQMPFAPFVGVNHHRQSILFGGALLVDETEATFTWLFNQFLNCMHNIAPMAIITDQDKAIGNAIKNVMPNSRHRFCAWHINKHLVEHLAPLRAKYEDFNSKLKELLKSNSIDDFEAQWDAFRHKYEIDDSSWLGKMYSQRKHWVKAFLKDSFFAGMTTSGRSESIHAFFDGYLNSSTMLNDFVVQYDNAVNARREAENDEDFRTMNTKAVLCGAHSIEKQAGDWYTRAMFSIFQAEWKKGMDLIHEKISKEGNNITYRVGLSIVDKSKWRYVNFQSNGDSFRSSCSCAKFVPIIH